jgi:cell division transport system permease protein
VTKLVGGSNAFVRRPFLYTGVLYGLGGALLAWALNRGRGRLALLAGPVERLALLYGSQFRLSWGALGHGGRSWLTLAAPRCSGWLGVLACCNATSPRDRTLLSIN